MDQGDSEHWERTIIKRYCKVTDGSHFSPETMDSGFPYVSVKDIGNNEIDLDNCKRISEEDFEKLSKNGCQPKPGDVLLTKDGTIGRAAVPQGINPFVVLSSLGILTPTHNLKAKFLYYYLISRVNNDQMYSTIHGSALTRLTIDKINNLQDYNPPLPEQHSITSYLDHKTALIDELVENHPKNSPAPGTTHRPHQSSRHQRPRPFRTHER
ncbi:MAG: restriction endonuclease subunit S [Saprospirales bacterium]|nr:restriction endonuclease subunit S [Saprospirales bacterium]